MPRDRVVWKIAGEAGLGIKVSGQIFYPAQTKFDGSGLARGDLCFCEVPLVELAAEPLVEQPVEGVDISKLMKRYA